ncbi:MAG: TRAP transporter large permease subunit [Succinivibrio dextrinosolvens]|uniref:TRAP transporter large permease subunit n=1 Tax=Succinivibrio sp. TaxID=2053619 RepID=UPI0025CDFFEB|nr:TRAP transporter large permease subunit [Succinivibrio sp.]MBQ9220551.1 TRAP transporter large permease subunit [Succinivibrio sp.]MDY6415975.1 TRAP transporter large permease subunit [Succinivibrio dextrinosolvens]
MTVAIFLAILLGSVCIGIPIAFSLLMCGFGLMWYMDMLDPQIVAQSLINGADNFTLLAIPFFVFAGDIMNVGGLAKRLVDLPMKLVGHKAGGLGYVVIIAAVIMASLSGSPAADTAAIAAIMFPMMSKASYPKEGSVGLIASGGIIAPIIPPSIPFIVIGVTASVSISQLFLAGIVPGILMGVTLCFVWSLRARKYEAAPKASAKEIMNSFKSSIWALMLPVIIIGGFKTGVFTPTEAGAVASVYALFISICIYRELTLKAIYGALLNTVKTSGVIMMMVAAAQVSAWLMTVADLPGAVIELLRPMIDSPKILLAFILLLLTVMGMVLDLIPIVLILVPVLMPLIHEAGINEIYFCVMFIICCSIGLITPPVGNVLNVVSSVTRVPFERSVIGILPYAGSLMLLLILLLIFPEIIIGPLNFMIGK